MAEESKPTSTSTTTNDSDNWMSEFVKREGVRQLLRDVLPLTMPQDDHSPFIPVLPSSQDDEQRRGRSMRMENDRETLRAHFTLFPTTSIFPFPGNTSYNRSAIEDRRTTLHLPTSPAASLRNRLLDASDCYRLVNVRLELKDMQRFINRIILCGDKLLLLGQGLFVQELLHQMSRQLHTGQESSLLGAMVSKMEPPKQRLVTESLLAISTFDQLVSFHTTFANDCELAPFYEWMSSLKLVIKMGAQAIAGEQITIKHKLQQLSVEEFKSSAVKLHDLGVSYEAMMDYVRAASLLVPKAAGATPATQTDTKDEPVSPVPQRDSPSFSSAE